ncbi:exodeoxyribonuclease V subunit alpha [Nakamurella deserti]|uniref:exodeoxyribonuclease V subunit alpha n=1 Tax=Nakamurella deserti TaxID=2164074 RepID=UPI000DBE1A45|nr:exodeoxyribonuclease V subunit alpha [Nakamurella deserti]
MNTTNPLLAAGAATADDRLTDPWDASLALGATGLLAVFNAAGMITAADVHVATSVGRLGNEADETVLLAVALAVRGLRQGSVCIDLGEQIRIDPTLPWPDLVDWYETVQASVLTTGNGPLRWDLDLLYLDRYWRQEVQVCFDLLDRATRPPPTVDAARLAAALDRHFPDRSEQRQAAEVAARRWTTVLGGGPGTGKTTTIARLLAVLIDQPGPAPRVALAAPTGKAAARMQEAVQEVQSRFAPTERDRLGTVTASTLHRLLGSRPGSGFGTRFAHDRHNRLPYDIVVVDETSMVSLTLMARLLEALRPETRLVLVGDPDQLASVEAGAVLADLVAGLTQREQRTPAPAAGQVGSGVVMLTRIHRFGGGIAELAHAVRDGDADEALDILLSELDDVSFIDPDAGDDLDDVRTDVTTSAAALRDAAADGDAPAALDALDRHRVLCAHRTGPYGVEDWSRRIERWLAESRSATHQAEWYLGRPVLVTANDYLLGLYNGDTGVVVAGSGPDGPTGDLRVAFRRQGTVVTFAPSRLSGLQTVHAMTVHRSQGSQFDHVTLVLPEPDSPLLTREMLYTALTRARGHVRLLGTEESFREAIARRAARASGLRERLAAGR